MRTEGKPERYISGSYIVMATVNNLKIYLKVDKTVPSYAVKYC